MKKDFKKTNIAIYGSIQQTGIDTLDSLQLAMDLGRYLAEKDVVVTIPTFPGFPLWVAKGAKKNHGTVIGFSPAANEKEQEDIYKLPSSYMDTIIYSGFGYVGSDLLLSRSSDAIIFGYGGIETIHEFWIAFRDKKPIGILQGDWDREEIFAKLLKKDSRFDPNTIFFSRNYRELVDRLTKEARKIRR